MTESSEERAGIADEQLPPDLVPGDDNPLAEPLEDGEDAGNLLEEGKTASESTAGEADDESGDETGAEAGDESS